MLSCASPLTQSCRLVSSLRTFRFRSCSVFNSTSFTSLIFISWRSNHFPATKRNDSVSNATQLAAALQHIAKQKCRLSLKKGSEDKRGSEHSLCDTRVPQRPLPPQKSPKTEFLTVNDLLKEDLGVFPASFLVENDAMTERDTTYLPSVKETAHATLPLKAILQEINDCSRSAYFRHMHNQHRRFVSSVSSKIGSSVSPSQQGSSTSSEYLSREFPWVPEIHRRWNLLPAHRKMYWMLRSPQGPYLCRLLFRSSLQRRRNRFTWRKTQRIPKGNQKDHCSLRETPWFAKFAQSLKGEEASSSLQVQRGIWDASSPAFPISSSSYSKDPALFSLSTVNLPPGKKSILPLGVRALISFEENFRSVRHRPSPSTSRRREKGSISHIDSKSAQQSNSHSFSTHFPPRNAFASFFLSSATSNAALRSAFLPLSALEFPATTQRVAEVAAAKKRRRQHIQWKRATNSLFRDERQKGSGLYALKQLKSMQRPAERPIIPDDVLQRGKIGDEDDKVMPKLLKMKRRQYFSSMCKCAPTMNDVIAEKDFQDYCALFNILSSPRKAYIMSKLEPRLEEIEHSPNKQLEQVQELARKFSLEYDEEMRKREKTAADICRNVNSNNVNEAVRNKEYFFSPEWLEESQREKARTRVQNFQDKLPDWKKLLIGF